MLPATCKPALPVVKDLLVTGSVAALPVTPATPTAAGLPVRRRRRSGAVAGARFLAGRPATRNDGLPAPADDRA